MSANPTTCFIDLYVDKNIVPRDDTTRRLMHCSFYADQRNKNAFNLEKQQQVLFTLYDVGKDKFDWQNASEMKLSLGFSRADAHQAAQSPFAFREIDLDCQLIGKRNSPAFGKDLQDPPKQNYPRIATYFQDSGDQALLEIVNSGQFEYGTRFEFSVGGTSYTYSFDPEMIVRDG